MRKPLVLILGLILLGLVAVNVTCPLFELHDYINPWTPEVITRYNLFDVMRGKPFYDSSQGIGISCFVLMMAGSICVLIGTITCFDNTNPLKVLSIVGTSIIALCSFVGMIFAMLSPVSFNRPGITFAELYFIAIGAVSAYYIYAVCKD